MGHPLLDGAEVVPPNELSTHEAHFQTKAAAIKAFMASEAKSMLRLALHARSRTLLQPEPGQIVYYWRQMSRHQKGKYHKPAKIFAVEGTLIRAPPEHLQPEITSNFVKLGAVPTLEDAVMTDTSELPVQPRPPKRNVRVRLTTKNPPEHANRPTVQMLPAQPEMLPAQPELLPARPELLPAQSEMLPAQPESLPTQSESLSVQPESLLTQLESKPAQHESLRQ
eukprot:3075199-Amphidinium_carterae.1